MNYCRWRILPFFNGGIFFEKAVNSDESGGGSKKIK